MSTNINTNNGQEIFYRILSEHRELSSLPQVLNEILNVSNDPRSSAADLANIIIKDPPLTAKVLRVVNSPYYGQAREITTVQDAVVALGMRSVTAIALSTSIYSFINKVDSSINRKRFWRHSLEVAIAARMIAEKCGYKPSDEAFVTGLLHDIGSLILEASFPEEFRRIWKLVEAGENQVTAEQRTWSTDHARAGQFILDQWGLPKKIGEAVRCHHEVFEYGGSKETGKLGQIINLANLISRFRTYNTPPPETRTLENKDIITANLNIPTEELNSICQNLVNEVVQESSYLEIEIGTTEEILHEANKILYRQLITVEDLLRENRGMKQRMGHDREKKAAFESLKTLAATFSHYLNTATATIRERAESIEASIARGDIVDKTGATALSTGIIAEAVDAIAMIIRELKNVTAFEATVYKDDSYLIEIEDKIKTQLENLEKTEVSS